MTLVVTDTGPLLHLHQIGAVELLSHLGTVYATPVVLLELRRHAPDFLAQGAPSWLWEAQPSSAALRQASLWTSAQMVDPGESEALAFAQDTKADLFVTDDAAARTLGESLGLQVRGTIGVILYSAVRGYLDQAAAVKILSDLEQRSTLWMSANVKAAASRGLAKIFERP